MLTCAVFFMVDVYPDNDSWNGTMADFEYIGALHSLRSLETGPIQQSRTMVNSEYLGHVTRDSVDDSVVSMDHYSGTIRPAMGEEPIRFTASSICNANRLA